MQPTSQILHPFAHHEEHYPSAEPFHRSTSFDLNEFTMFPQAHPTEARLNNGHVKAQCMKAGLMSRMPGTANPSQSGEQAFNANGALGSYTPVSFGYTSETASQSTHELQLPSSEIATQNSAYLWNEAMENNFRQDRSQFNPQAEALLPNRQPDQNGKFHCWWLGCGDKAGFSRDLSLWRHIKAKHLYTRSFPCAYCGKRYDRFDSLQTHQRTTGHLYI